MKNLSIRKTIILYMTINLVISFFLSAFIIGAAEKVQNHIWRKYTAQQKVWDYEYVKRVSNYVMEPLDVHISETCDFLETWTVLLVSIGGSIGVIFLFYRNKIKVPLDELQNGSRMIAENNLNFTIAYSNQDELGRLCAEFERMRRQLEVNNKYTWKMAEQEKALRSAIAHDIRSPLSILKGYQEMLLEYIPDEKLDKQWILDMLESGMGQIEHLHKFIDTMAQLSRLEDRQVNWEEVDMGWFATQAEDIVDYMGKDSGKECTIKVLIGDNKVKFDCYMVIEALENLLANGLRYAVDKVEIEITLEGNKLCIGVMDDGSGFAESPEVVTKINYHANPQDDDSHFGVGLYLCRLYCEKHDGRLLIGSQEGGARVKAVFKVRGLDE